ncbi:metallophosphoesterase [Candidatus Latescibacterota bacterium]
MVFLVISVTIVGILYGYCGWRLLVPARLPYPYSLLAWLSLAALAVLPHTYILVIRSSALPGWLRDSVAWLAYVGLGIALLTFSLLLLRDLGWVGWRILEWLACLFGTGADTAEAADSLVHHPERRRFLLNAANLGVLALSAAGTGWGMYHARRRPRVVHIEVPVRGLPVAFEGFRIVQITDLHVGPTIKGDFVQAVVDTANQLAGDAIALTGDLVDGSVSHLRPHVEPLAQLRAPFGQYFVTGNHEYYSGVEEWVAQVRRLGFDVLLNEHRVLRRDGAELVIAGVTDCSSSNGEGAHVHDPVAALDGAPAGVRRVLLAHQPRSVYDARKAGFDLMLSGHTHGGQFAPWKYLIPLQQPYVAGLHQVEEGSWIYVSRGTGYWGPPVRLTVPSEITCLTLTRV